MIEKDAHIAEIVARNRAESDKAYEKAKMTGRISAGAEAEVVIADYFAEITANDKDLEAHQRLLNPTKDQEAA
jgi:formylmethanofuran dehydrogenase subunit A